MQINTFPGIDYTSLFLMMDCVDSDSFLMWTPIKLAN